MKAIVTAFFKAVNSVIKLFGGEVIDIDAQLTDVYKWFGELGFNID